MKHDAVMYQDCWSHLFGGHS